MKTLEVAQKTDINPDPFCPVQLTNIMHNGRNTDKFMIELQAAEGDQWIPLPGVGAVHTADYRLVSNHDVYDLAQSVLNDTKMKFQPVPSFGAGHSKPIFWDGKRFSAKWFIPEASVDTRRGSTMMLGVEVRNSYDGSCKVGLAFFAMHCACSNQFYSANMLGQPFVLPHVNRGGELKDDVADAMEEIRGKAKSFAKMTRGIHFLQETKFDGFKGFLGTRRRILDVTGVDFRDRALLDELSGCGTTHKLGLKDVAAAYGDPDTFWALANAYTAITTHDVGGLRGADQSGRVIDCLLDQVPAFANN